MSTLSDGENDAIVRFGGRPAIRRALIVTVGMVVRLSVRDLARRRRRPLFKKMMDTMGGGKDQEE